MAEFSFVIVLVVVSVVGLIVVHRMRSGAGAVRAQFAKHAETPIADAIVGVTTRISGTVRAVGPSPTSEVSDRAWVARDLRIAASDGGSAPTRPAQQAVDFVVEDDTGIALVRGSDVLVSIDRDFEAPETTLDQQPWADRLLRSGGYTNGSPQTCRLRIYEGVISPGDRVGVVGRVEPAGPDARRLGATVLVRPVQSTRVALRREDDA